MGSDRREMGHEVLTHTGRSSSLPCAAASPYPRCHHPSSRRSGTSVQRCSQLTTRPIRWGATGIPDRAVFAKLVQVLVFGCAYHRIANETVPATTLRRRRDAWIAAGVMDTLLDLALVDYDRMIGLELADIAVDGCITNAPCGGEMAGRSPVDRGNQGRKRSTLVDANGFPLGTVAAPANRHDSPLLAPTLDGRPRCAAGDYPGQSRSWL